ncbi:MAG: hypothetical protein EOO89_31520, partial [Pedobacter sp.]
AIYYFTPLYWLLLSNRFTKRILFRGFGYKGSLDFTTYPDTWIRDLPILKLGIGVYLANKATIGTNLCLADGTIYVAPITIGDHSVVGHMCMIAPGLRMGRNSELGSGSALGVRVTIGDRVNVGPCAGINHYAKIANGVKIGAQSYIGIRAQINVEGMTIPAFSNIPANSVINAEDDLQEILRSNGYRAEVRSTNKLITSDDMNVFTMMN